MVPVLKGIACLSLRQKFSWVGYPYLCPSAVSVTASVLTISCECLKSIRATIFLILGILRLLVLFRLLPLMISLKIIEFMNNVQGGP